MVKVLTLVRIVSILMIILSLVLLFVFIVGLMTTVVSILNYLAYRGYYMEFDRTKGVMSIRATIPVRNYCPLQMRIGLKLRILDGVNLLAEDEEEILLDFGKEKRMNLRITMSMDNIKRIEKLKFMTILYYTILDLLTFNMSMEMRVAIYG
ncbi:MAG: hypothetical protein DRJ49_07525 [Thermoprotei archaeon]|nr:MAG: hypothetical protein DRJ49_07525 [Thermoprotei archaeon]